MSTLKVNTINAATSGQAVAVDVKNPKTLRNLIINGAMTVAQRGTSTTTNLDFAADRWKLSSNGLGVTITNSQQALTSSDTPYSYGFRKSTRLALASAGTAGAGNWLQYWYTAEAQDIANSGWNYTSSSSYITISFWARASSSQTYGCVFETNDGTSYLYPKSFALTANTWTKVSFSVPGNSNLTINDDNGAGLIIKVFPYLGTTYSGGTDATWAAASGAGYGSMGDTSTWLTAGASTFDLTGVQLEVGSYVTDFEHRSYGDELARCQRYYKKLGGKGVEGQPLMTLACQSSSLMRSGYEFIPEMRAAPSITSSSIIGITNGNGSAGSPTLTVSPVTNQSGRINASGMSGLVQGDAGWIQSDSGTGHISFSAEL